MCIRVWGTHHRYSVTTSPRELAEIVGGLDNLVYHDPGWGLPWGDIWMWEGLQDHCLCHTDVRATLTQAGVPWEEDDWAGDVRITPQS